MSAVEATELVMGTIENDAEVDRNGDDSVPDRRAEEPGSAEGEPLALSAVVGSLLFVSPRPISLEALSEASGRPAPEVEEALLSLQEVLQAGQVGFSLHEVSGGYQLRTTPRASRAILNLIPPRAKRLSRAAAETLAVIAYKQPVQRSEIEAIRGVDALPTIKTLLDAKLIRVVGRDESVGQPTLYGTTMVFLEKFGLKDLSELPSVREISQLVEEPGEAETSSEAPDAVPSGDCTD